MKNLILFLVVSTLLMSCGGSGVQPTDNITWGQAFNHVSKSFSYWIWIVVAFLAIVAYIFKVASGKIQSLNLLLLFGLAALLMLAIFMRPSEVAANTTVEQAARGVYIGY